MSVQFMSTQWPKYHKKEGVEGVGVARSHLPLAMHHTVLSALCGHFHWWEGAKHHPGKLTISLRIGQRSQSIVIALPGSVPNFQSHNGVVEHHIGAVRVENYEGSMDTTQLELQSQKSMRSQKVLEDKGIGAGRNIFFETLKHLLVSLGNIVKLWVTFCMFS